MPVTETAAVVLRLAAVVREEDGLWVAGCPSLDVFTQGDSQTDAKEGLQEAVELWIDSCLERNSLGKALRELGWYRVHPGTPISDDTDVLGVMREPERASAGQSEEYPLEISIPAYQAALFSGVSDRAHS